MSNTITQDPTTRSRNMSNTITQDALRHITSKVLADIGTFWNERTKDPNEIPSCFVTTFVSVISIYMQNNYRDEAHDALISDFANLLKLALNEVRSKRGIH